MAALFVASRTVAVDVTPRSSFAIGESTLNVPVGNTTVRRTHAVRWRLGATGAARDLGVLPRDDYSAATGIDDAGRVLVGISSATEVSRATRNRAGEVSGVEAAHGGE